MRVIKSLTNIAFNFFDRPLPNPPKTIAKIRWSFVRNGSGEILDGLILCQTQEIVTNY